MISALNWPKTAISSWQSPFKLWTPALLSKVTWHQYNNATITTGSDSSPVVFTLPITPCALLGKGCERRLWTSHPVTQKSTSQSLTRFSVQAKSTYLPRSIISPSWTTRIWSAFIIVDNLQLLQKEDCKWLFGNWLLGVQTSPFETENLAQHCQPVRV